MVSSCDACSAGACLPGRDLCHGAFLHWCFLPFRLSQKTSRTCSDHSRSASPARAIDLACLFVRASGARLVLVASLPPESCQLFPHQASSEGWLTLAGSHHPLGFVLAHSCAQTSKKFPGSAGVPGNLCACCLPACFSLKGVLNYDHSSCRRRCSSAGYPFQDPALLAQRGQCALGRTPDRCTYEMCDGGTPAAGGEIAWSSAPICCLFSAAGYSLCSSRCVPGNRSALADQRDRARFHSLFVACPLRFSRGPDPETDLPGNQSRDASGAVRPTRADVAAGTGAIGRASDHGPGVPHATTGG